MAALNSDPAYGDQTGVFHFMGVCGLVKVMHSLLDKDSTFQDAPRGQKSSPIPLSSVLLNSWYLAHMVLPMYHRQRLTHSPIPSAPHPGAPISYECGIVRNAFDFVKGYLLCCQLPTKFRHTSSLKLRNISATDVCKDSPACSMLKVQSPAPVGVPSSEVQTSSLSRHVERRIATNV